MASTNDTEGDHKEEKKEGNGAQVAAESDHHHWRRGRRYRPRSEGETIECVHNI